MTNLNDKTQVYDLMVQVGHNREVLMDLLEYLRVNEITMNTFTVWEIQKVVSWLSSLEYDLNKFLGTRDKL